MGEQLMFFLNVIPENVDDRRLVGKPETRSAHAEDMIIQLDSGEG